MSFFVDWIAFSYKSVIYEMKLNGNFRDLNWRHLPCKRPKIHGDGSGDIPSKYGRKYGSNSMLGSWNSHHLEAFRTHEWPWPQWSTVSSVDSTTFSYSVFFPQETYPTLCCGWNPRVISQSTVFFVDAFCWLIFQNTWLFPTKKVNLITWLKSIPFSHNSCRFLHNAGGKELHEGLRYGLQFPHSQHQERCRLGGGTTLGGYFVGGTMG